ncbi:MFS transporter [Stappia sp. BW2]|uniref:MFS transporter n=1 Tax=Stappia sp. BW2 TaxID=2592622 RepID=UPI0011DEBA92|nr:MFS transporter [Stappia sp. BW2]TYC65147.1 MFS transporter [Stappia sp. BW2]
MSLLFDGAAGGRPNRWAALVALYLAMFMNILDVTVVNLALPSIRQGLGATDTQLEWVLVVYVLAFAAGLLPFGRFGDVAGRGRMFRWGVAGFTVSSLACGLAPDITFLIASRALQGLCAAMMVPQVLAIVHVIFPAEEKGKAIGLFGSVSALGAVAGPLLGGAIVAADLFGLGWRPIFLINLPVGLISLAGALRFLPQLETENRVTPDWAGTFFFVVAVLALVFPLVEGRQFGWPVWCFALMGLSAVLAVLFYRLQRRKARLGRAQLLPVVLTRDRVFVAGVAFVALFFSSLAGLFFMMALFLQAGLGLSPMMAGFILAPHPVGVILASTLTGRFGTRYQAARISLAMLAVFCGLFAARLLISQGTPASLLVVPFLIVGLGTGATIPALFQLVLSRVSGPDAGAGSGVLQAFQQIGMALGIAVQGQIFFHGLAGARSEALYREAAASTLLYPVGVCCVLTLLAVGLACKVSNR